MSETIVVSVTADRSRFMLYGGSPTAKDEVYAAVTSWAGWRRTIGKKELAGRIVGVYSAPVWPSTALSLANTTLTIQWHGDAQRVVEDQLERLGLARASLTTNKPGSHAVSTDRKPMLHQWQAIMACIHLPTSLGARVLLSDDMGLGKTSESLWIAQSQGCKRILVICPASVKFNWEREVQVTLGWDCFVIDGTPKQRASVFANVLFAAANSHKAVAVINYDLLPPLPDTQVGILMGFAMDQALICDESHYLKSRKSQRTKFVMRHLAPPAGGAKVRILCTGTPVFNMVDDLWSQAQILRPGTWTSYWDFEKRYLVLSSQLHGAQKQGKVVGTKNLKELNAIMNTMQIRRETDDVLGLPLKVHTYPELELTGDHKKIYQAMKKLAVLEIESLGLGPDDSIFSVQARGAVIAMLRCEQIAQGFCGGIPEVLVEKLGKVLSSKAKQIPGRPREIIFPDSPKMAWLLETIEGLVLNKKRVVVFSRFNAPMFWLQKHIEDHTSCAVLHGAMTSKQKDELVVDFQDDCYDVLFVQVKMAQGFNLHNSQDCIFLGRDWAPAVNRQAEGRLHRKGQLGTVNVQIPIVRGTIEAYIHKKLMSKEADAQQALKNVTIKDLLEML